MLKCYLSAESPNKQRATVNIQVRLAVKPLHISNSEYMHQYQIMIWSKWTKIVHKIKTRTAVYDEAI